MGMIGAGISGVSALAGLFGGTPASQVQMPPMQNNYTNAPGADQGAYGGIGNLGQYNVAGQNLAQYQQLAQQGVNSPYAQQYQQGANATGQAGMQSGAGITGTALNQLGGVNSLMSMGFDPQQALYSQLQNQNQQQNLAMLGNSGVAGTPYGQGVAGYQNDMFNMNWQNQQLQRASQGAGAAGSLLNSIGGATNTGLGQMQQGAALPYQASQGITGNQLGLLGQAGNYGAMASQNPQQQITDYLQYLQGATGQQGANNQTAQVGLNQANMGFQQSQALGGQLGQSLAGLGKGWGTAFGGGSSGGGFANNSWGQSNPGVAGSAFYGPTA